jgi:hypothetical protein
VSPEAKKQIDQLRLENMAHHLVLSALINVLDTLHPERNIAQAIGSLYAETLMHFAPGLSQDAAEAMERYLRSMVDPPSR